MKPPPTRAKEFIMRVLNRRWKILAGKVIKNIYKQHHGLREHDVIRRRRGQRRALAGVSEKKRGSLSEQLEERRHEF